MRYQTHLRLFLAHGCSAEPLSLAARRLLATHGRNAVDGAGDPPRRSGPRWVTARRIPRRTMAVERRRRLGELLVGEVGECRATPQAEGGAKLGCTGVGVPLAELAPALPHPCLELADIDRVGVGVELVAGRA